MTRRRLALWTLWIGLALPALAVPTPASSPTTPTKAKPTARPPARKPPLDFSGTWDLDLQASKNVVPVLEKGLMMTVRQTGDRIWMEASGPGAPKADDVIIADGRSYKKELGPGGSGTVTARWSPDGTALLLEIVAGERDAPRAVQRTRWTLSPDKKTWWRHTVTLEDGERRETGLAFRRRAPAPARTRTPKPPKTAQPTKAETR